MIQGQGDAGRRCRADIGLAAAADGDIIERGADVADKHLVELSANTSLPPVIEVASSSVRVTPVAVVEPTSVSPRR